MDASVFAHALLLHKADSRADILALLPARNRDAVEKELAPIANFSPKQLHGSLRTLREAQAARERTKAEETLGISLKHAAPRLIAWLARPF
jgi:flagellar motor switch protein FliG